MFYGFLRVSEAVALKCEHVRLVWKVAGQEIKTKIDFCPPGGEPHAVQIHLLVSKTDQEGRGQLVQIAALPRSDPLRSRSRLCTFRLIEFLWKKRRDGQVRAFAHVRPNLPPAGICNDTVRGRLKTYLSRFLPAERHGPREMAL
jgi:hypothetical protein